LVDVRLPRFSFDFTGQVGEALQAVSSKLWVDHRIWPVFKSVYNALRVLKISWTYCVKKLSITKSQKRKRISYIEQTKEDQMGWSYLAQKLPYRRQIEDWRKDIRDGKTRKKT
jgi:hypothetical protein